MGTIRNATLATKEVHRIIVEYQPKSTLLAKRVLFVSRHVRMYPQNHRTDRLEEGPSSDCAYLL